MLKMNYKLLKSFLLASIFFVLVALIPKNTYASESALFEFQSVILTDSDDNPAGVIPCGDFKVYITAVNSGYGCADLYVVEYDASGKMVNMSRHKDFYGCATLSLNNDSGVIETLKIFLIEPVSLRPVSSCYCISDSHPCNCITGQIIRLSLNNRIGINVGGIGTFNLLYTRALEDFSSGPSLLNYYKFYFDENGCVISYENVAEPDKLVIIGTLTDCSAEGRLSLSSGVTYYTTGYSKYTGDVVNDFDLRPIVPYVGQPVIIQLDRGYIHSAYVLNTYTATGYLGEKQFAGIELSPWCSMILIEDGVYTHMPMDCFTGMTFQAYFYMDGNGIRFLYADSSNINGLSDVIAYYTGDYCQTGPDSYEYGFIVNGHKRFYTFSTTPDDKCFYSLTVEYNSRILEINDIYQASTSFTASDATYDHNDLRINRVSIPLSEYAIFITCSSKCNSSDIRDVCFADYDDLFLYDFDDDFIYDAVVFFREEDNL